MDFILVVIFLTIVNLLQSLMFNICKISKIVVEICCSVRMELTKTWKDEIFIVEVLMINTYILSLHHHKMFLQSLWCSYQIQATLLPRLTNVSRKLTIKQVQNILNYDQETRHFTIKYKPLICTTLYVAEVHYEVIYPKTIEYFYNFL